VTLRRTETWRRGPREDGVLARDLQDLRVPYLTGAAWDLLVVAGLSWDRTLDREPSDPSGLRVL